MQIRQLAPDDIEALAQLFVRAYDKSSTADEARTYLEKFSAFEPESCLIALEEEAPIGAVIAFSYVKVGRPVLFLQDLFVDPERRNRGCARRLIEVLRERFARDATVTVVPLVKADTTVLNFYNSLGFEQQSAFTFLDR